MVWLPDIYTFKKKRIKHSCPNCRRNFFITPSIEKRIKVQFCSRKCKNAYLRTERNCIKCGKKFYNAPSDEKSNRRHCSNKCRISTVVYKKCPICNKKFKTVKHRKEKPQVYCSIQCRSEGARRNWHRGKDHWAWTGGKKFLNGYVYIKNGRGYRAEHRLKIEEKIGRALKRHEWVHHRNGNKHDNRLRNLQIVTHIKHHHEVECPYCQNEFLIH